MSTTTMQTYEPAKALGRLFNHNANPDGASAEKDRQTVLAAIRSSYLMDYLCDSGAPGSILIVDKFGETPHVIERERSAQDSAGESDQETVEAAIERDLMEHGTQVAKDEYWSLR
jgi:hypothetical protein